MKQEQFDRFKDASWFPKQEESVMVGGVGGIGSWLTLLLVRAGFKPTIYDFDRIETHNLGGQLFGKEDIGFKKVEVVSNIVYDFCNEWINTFAEKITNQSPTHHFMFSCFDNMKARKDLFEVWTKSFKDIDITPIFIDGRLHFEQLQIFCVTPDNKEKYEKDYLFDDDAVEDTPCTLRQTSHSAAMIASHMVAFFTNHISNIYEKNKARNVPFFYEYFIPLTLNKMI